MPRLKRRNYDTPALTDEQRDNLLDRGMPAVLRIFTSEQARRRAWQASRDGLLAEYVRTNPLSRPRAWWDYDAPEPRRVVSGPPLPEGVVLSCGVPRCHAPGDPEREYETEAAYLRRLGLLLASEADDG